MPEQTPQGKVLIVDDEEGIRLFLSDELRQAGYRVEEADSAENALSLLEKDCYDVLLLDLRLGGMDGVRLMRQVKESWPKTEIIILTAFATIDSAVEAVRYNAFDYLRKPCNANEVVRSVGAAWEQKQAAERQPASGDAEPFWNTSDTVVRTGQLLLDYGARRVTLAGRPLSFTPTEYELLFLLGRSLGRPVSLEKLIREGLGYDPDEPGNQDTIRVYISRLRRKLGPNYILTTRIGGYMLAKLPPVS